LWDIEWMSQLPFEVAVEPSQNHAATRVLRRMQDLRRAALDLEVQHAEAIAATAPGLRASARNLVHYVAIRSYDIRALQADLAELGLSSLGRLEAHVMATLERVLTLLHQMLGVPVPAELDGRAADLSMRQGAARLARHATALLGPSPPERKTRIMVTMPGEAADDPALIHDLLALGMQVMRINCAHDGPVVWARMVLHLRRAERRLGKKCKVSFDLAGPKLRTGPIEAVAGVVKWKPQRDIYGRVIAPAVVSLRSSSVETPPGQRQLVVTGALVAVARVGDKVELSDARRRHRRLTVVEVRAGECVCHARKTAYVISGTRIRLRRRKKLVARGSIAQLPMQTQDILLKPGDQLDVVNSSAPGRPARAGRGDKLEPALIGCDLPEVFARVRPGQRIFLDDGRIEGLIKETNGERIRVDITRVTGRVAKLGGEKGINLPDTALHLPALTTTDRNNLDFVARHADMVALSFVQRPADIEALIAELQRRPATHIGIILKIETRHAFDHLPRLLLTAMRYPLIGVMVARGDLGVEVGFDRLSEVQEEILWLCEAAHLPAIWATQVLESLAKDGVSSRAEVTDAAMASRAECVMLNKGPYILDALSFLSNVLHRMQAHQTKKTATLRRLRISHIER
jgi:pyruvate kinase